MVCVYVVKMLPIYLFLCPCVCFIASVFVAVIVALLPSSESISLSFSTEKRGESLCMRCLHTYIWSIFNNGIETQTRTPPHTHSFTIGFLPFFFFGRKGFAWGMEGRTIKEWKWHKYVIQDI